MHFDRLQLQFYLDLLCLVFRLVDVDSVTENVDICDGASAYKEEPDIAKTEVTFATLTTKTSKRATGNYYKRNSNQSCECDHDCCGGDNDNDGFRGDDEGDECAWMFYLCFCCYSLAQYLLAIRKTCMENCNCDCDCDCE